MTQQQILEALRTEYGSIAECARQLGVGRNSIYESANGSGSHKIRVAIATMLNKKPSDLWPALSIQKRLHRNKDDKAYLQQ